MTPTMSKIKVYYNSACPVCNAGIKDQRQRMEGCSTEVDWIDIHSIPDAVKEIGVGQEFVRERLHVVDENGVVRVGADAFSTLWNHTPDQKWLAWLINLPVINVMTRWAYNIFAAMLYAWNRANHRW